MPTQKLTLTKNWEVSLTAGDLYEVCHGFSRKSNRLGNPGFSFTPAPLLDCDINRISQVFEGFKTTDMLEILQVLEF